MATKLFIGGLAWATTDQTLRDTFSQAGNVVSAVVITDKFSGRSKGFGFVEYETEEEANAAIEMFNGKEIDGRAIIVSEAKPMAPRDNSSRGGFGGDRRGGGSRGGDRRGGSRY